MAQFPKNIFQVWFQGCENITNPLFKENVKNWQLLNPDWDYYCLNDNDLRKICYQYSSRCGQYYDIARAMHTKIDLAKIVCIYLYGGIMIDMDMYVLRGLSTSKIVNEIVNYYEQTGEPIVGLSRTNHGEMESLFLYKMLKSYNNAVIITSPLNPLLKKYIDRILNKIQELQSYPTIKDFQYVQKTTSPTEFNDFLYYNIDSKDTKVVGIDHRVFEPCLIGETCRINNDTISLHRFELSWVTETGKGALEGLFNAKILQAVCLIFLIAILYLLIRNNYFTPKK